MTKKFQDKPRTLTEADISTRRAITRRSLLASLGITLGAAAAAVAGRAIAEAQGPASCTDIDRGPNEDPPGMGRRCSGRPTGCTDTDQGRNEDPPNYGRGCWI